MILRILCLFAFVAYALPSNAAFFNLRNAEKQQLAACGLYLYFKEYGIGCPMAAGDVTEELYNKFVDILEKNTKNEFYAQEEASMAPRTLASGEHLTTNPIAVQKRLKEAHASKAHLPEVYRSYNNFKNNIVSVCTRGRDACQHIKTHTERSPMLERKKCNQLCSGQTCRDIFTLSMCYAMYKNEVCPLNTVSSCLKNEYSASYHSELARRGWQDYASLSENWTHLFYRTVAEPAPGKHLGLRVAQATGVGAVLAALPVVLYAAAPIIAINVGALAIRYGAKKGLDLMDQLATEKLTNEFYARKHRRGGYTDTQVKFMAGCRCECPKIKSVRAHT